MIRRELVVGPSRGGEDDAVDVAVAGGIELRGHRAEEVDGEVMAAQQPVRAEAQDLLACVAFDVIGERHFQPIVTSCRVVSTSKRTALSASPLPLRCQNAPVIEASKLIDLI